MLLLPLKKGIKKPPYITAARPGGSLARNGINFFTLLLSLAFDFPDCVRVGFVLDFVKVKGLIGRDGRFWSA